MKKNRLNTYFLLASVVVVWAIIAMKVYKNLNKKSDSELIHRMNFEEVDMSFLDRKYELNLSYEDPFLGNSSKRRPVHLKNGKKESGNRKSQKKTDDPLTKIKYYGSIKGSSKIAIIEIEGRSLIVKEDEERFNCKIQKIYDDAIMILINGKQAKIMKES